MLSGKPPSLTRRSFLKKSLGSFLLLSFTSLLPLACTRKKANRESFLFLSPEESHTLYRAMQALAQGTGSSLEASWSAIRSVDTILIRLSPPLKKQLKLLLRFLEWSPILLFFSFAYFSDLSVSKRAHFLNTLSQSRFSLLRQIHTAIRALAMTGLYAQPKSWQPIGYDGPWIGRFEIPTIVPPLSRYDS